MTSPAFLSSVIGACGFAEGIAVMLQGLTMMSSPLRLTLATLAGFARFHPVMLRAQALIMFPFFVASMLG